MIIITHSKTNMYKLYVWIRCHIDPVWNDMYSSYEDFTSYYYTKTI